MNMIEVKAGELCGAALDWAVSKSEGDDHWTSDRKVDWFAWRMRNWKPSTDWSAGGPIIDKSGVALTPFKEWEDGNCWAANVWGGMAHEGYIPTDYYGPTLLIAAMRAIVAAKLGNVVSVPDELINQ